MRSSGVAMIIGLVIALAGGVTLAAQTQSWSLVTIIGASLASAGVIASWIAWRWSLGGAVWVAGPKNDTPQRSDTDGRRFERVLRALLEAAVGAFVGLGFYVLTREPRSAMLSAAAVGVAVSASALLIGGLLGFLFAIPRSLQEGRPTPSAQTGKAPSAAPTDQPPLASSAAVARPNPSVPSASSANDTHAHDVAFATNTNLEQISDWLTKVLVGVGLTQLNSIPTKLHALGVVLGPAMGDTGLSSSDTVGPGGWVGVALALFFCIDGFLYGYLWTRLFGASFLAEAAMDMIRPKIVQQVLATVDAQSQRDAQALKLVARQLDASSDTPPVDPSDLRNAILAASPDTRVEMFTQAKTVRSSNWRLHPELVARTIPIFEALVAADTAGTSDRSHGQLGYALKDQQPPDYDGAAKELTRAIEIRNSTGGAARFLYEFNRAVCRIYLDADGFGAGKPSSADVKNKILADLRVASHLKEDQKKALGHSIFDEPPIDAWANLNGVSTQDIYESKI
jgi:hypothetical protein